MKDTFKKLKDRFNCHFLDQLLENDAKEGQLNDQLEAMSIKYTESVEEVRRTKCCSIQLFDMLVS